MSERSVDLGPVPHPREQHVFLGHPAAEQAFANAVDADRLHHAWLIAGPEGIGKATLAYRVARYLLADPTERLRGEGGVLGIDPESRTARQVAAGSHPNLSVLDLEAANADADRPPAKTVSVKTARRALTFFGTTSANGGHRVCIVDSAEDLTLQAANALLKTVEEPPARSTVLIVSHAPQSVLPTIRSRCRKLNLGPLAQADVLQLLRRIAPETGRAEEGGPDILEQAAEQAEGSIRRALGLLDPKRLALLAELTNLLELLPEPPMLRVLALAEKLGDRRSGSDFHLALDAVQRWTAERIRARATQGARRLAPLAELCEKIGDAAASVETYNLDRRPLVISMFGGLADAVREAG